MIDVISLFNTKKSKKVKVFQDIIYWGVDNQLPEDIIYLYNDSPTNNGIITRKTSLASGSDYGFSTADGEAFAKQIGFKKLFNKALRDYFCYGAFSLQIVKDWADPSIANIIYQDTSQIRLSTRPETPIAINVDWCGYKTDTLFYPEYTLNTNPSDAISFLFYKIESLGQTYYPVPTWWSSKTAIRTEIELLNYSENLIDNSFTSTGILKVPKMSSPEEVAEMKRNIRKDLAGSNNAGKIMVVQADENKTVEWTPIQQNIDSTQIDGFLEMTRKSIIIAHNLPSPTIIGLPGGASLGGDGATIDTANKIFFENDILAVQNEMIDIFESLFTKAGVPCKITIQNKLLTNDTSNTNNGTGI